jgi:deoxyribodipyrimidine photo-lyase
MDTAIVVFTRDLRLHDNPALHQACARARQVVPLFVTDPAIAASTRSPNRARFLAESLADLRASLHERGGDLVIRDGDPAAEVIALAGETKASAVYLADDVSHYATARRRKLERECARHRLDLALTPGLTVVPPGDLKPPAEAITGSSPPTGGPGARPPGAGTTRCRAPSSCPPSATPAGSPRPAGTLRAQRRAASRPAGGGSPPGARASWRATTRTTTTWPAMRPPGSAPTCGSAACRRSRWRSARSIARPEISRARSSAGSWPGVTSSTR